jgi:hypothetical protein
MHPGTVTDGIDRADPADRRVIPSQIDFVEGVIRWHNRVLAYAWVLDH